MLYFVPNALGTRFWDCTLHSRHVTFFMPKWIPEFWLQVVKEWFQLKWKPIQCCTIEISNQILWCNSHICVQDRPLNYEQCISSGLMYVHDLYNNNGTVKSFFEIRAEYCINNWEYITNPECMGKNAKRHQPNVGAI